MLALLAGLYGGLFRLGWLLPPLTETLPALHGPLMVPGFLGTLIGLERATALQKPWSYAVPLLTALGILSFSLGFPYQAGILLMTSGSLGMVALSVILIRRQHALYTVVMGLGALLWFIGNLLWLARFGLSIVAFWWAGFLLITIAGERLELSRLLRPSRGSLTIFLSAILSFTLGLILLPQSYSAGVPIAGAGMLILALWLVNYDIARHNLHQVGLPRYISICLILAYLWLGVGGVLSLFYRTATAAPPYDAILHSLFLGFVFSMIFGHAPIIFPSLLHLPFTFSPTLYIPLSLLHLSLLLRLSGDLMFWIPARQWGGLFNAIAILLFLANLAFLIILSLKK